MSNEQRASRGLEIKRRRLVLGIKTPTEFARATGVDRQTIKRAEAGGSGESTYDVLEAWLDAKDVEHSSETEEAEVHLVSPREEHEEEMLEMSLTIAALGIDAKVKGARDHPEVIREQLLELVRGIIRETKGEGI